MKQKINSFALLKWIADNGGQEAKLYLSQQTGLTVSTINRMLNNTTKPQLGHRYSIYVVTGVRLREEDNFPETEIKKREAS